MTHIYARMALVLGPWEPFVKASWSDRQWRWYREVQ